jgi:uncharacterized protein (DUF2147 family)
MRRVGFLLAGLSAVALAGSAGAATWPAEVGEQPANYGVWRNPKGSVQVEIKPCGPNICGEVVWANEKAMRDAREGGHETLIGMQLFRDFVQVKPGSWKGKVFVPDLNRTFTGVAERIDATTMRAKGCVLPIIACKAQIWTRVR